MLETVSIRWQQQTCAAAVCFRYHPDFLAVAKRVTAENSESALQAELVFLAVVFSQFAPISVQCLASKEAGETRPPPMCVTRPV